MFCLRLSGDERPCDLGGDPAGGGAGASRCPSAFRGVAAAGGAAGGGAASNVATPPAAAPRVLVCLPKGSAALEPQVERAFSWASLATISPDNVARRFPPSAASRAIAADERRLDELVRAAEADFLALKFDDATARLDEGAARSSTRCRRRCGTRRRTCACSCCRAASRRRAATRAPRRRSRAPARRRSTSSWTRPSTRPPSARRTRRRARPCGRGRGAASSSPASRPAPRSRSTASSRDGRRRSWRCRRGAASCRSRAPASSRTSPSAPPIARRVTLEPAGKEGLRDQLRDRIATDPAWFLEPLLLETLAAEENARWVVVLDRDAGARAQGAGLLGGRTRAEAGRAVAPAGRRAGQAVRRGARPRAAHAASGGAGDRHAAAACPRWRRAPAIRAWAARSRSCAARAARISCASAWRRAGRGGSRATLPSLLASDGEWDVEYYVEGRDAHAARSPAARAMPAAPLRFRRAGTVTVAASASPSRWYLWTALAVVAAGAAATGVYFVTRSDDVSVKLVPP